MFLFSLSHVITYNIPLPQTPSNEHIQLLTKRAECYADWESNRFHVTSHSEFRDDHDRIHAAVDDFAYNLDAEDLRRFFIFITGKDRVPLVNEMRIYVLDDGNGLPSSQTCFNHLNLRRQRYMLQNVINIDMVAEDLRVVMSQYSYFGGDS